MSTPTRAPDAEPEEEPEQRETQPGGNEMRERKQRILTHGTPSITSSIADAVVIKDENIFLVTSPDGGIPLSQGHGFGLYYHDCRFIRTYELCIAGASPTVLASTAAKGDSAIFQLANQDIHTADGQLIPKETIGVKWARAVHGSVPLLHDSFTFENFGLSDVEFPISLTFGAQFEDIFAVRGLFSEKLGDVLKPEWKDDALVLAYDGADGRRRSATIELSPAPAKREMCGARFDLELSPRDSVTIDVEIRLADVPEGDAANGHPRESPNSHPRESLNSHPRESGDPSSESASAASSESSATQTPGKILGDDRFRGSVEKPDATKKRDARMGTRVHSDSLLLNAVVERSLGDLKMLISSIDDQEFFAAGIPWFATLFGRDSIITALQTLAYQPAIARHTARLLAHYQGDRVDEWRDEQPGKILHSLRVGEMARLGQIPHTPYYGSVDATPLFLILIGRHAAWTGDIELFESLRDNVELALNWMSSWGDQNHDGYIEYASTSERGLINQGWKDSGDAIVDSDGHLADPPIALVEVQGYAYQARMLIADLYERTGEAERAKELRKEAATLRERFNHDFWMAQQNFYALALEKGDAQVTVISSNPGHALWAGIADDDKASAVVERLMQPDMYNGWGIRTLSQDEKRYNPVGYHLGTVWPHDNSMIAVGFRRYGYDAEAHRILSGLVEAAMHFSDYRLPELFAGFARDEYDYPVRFPVACHPQAWAAGSVPYLMEAMLGFSPNAFEKRLSVVRPLLPDFVNHMEIHDLAVGNARVSLRFERTPENTTAVTVLDTDGELEVVVEPAREMAEREREREERGKQKADGGKR
jgi:glycogen debranching enzyme